MHEEWRGACMNRLAQLGSFHILCPFPLLLALSGEVLLLLALLPSLSLKRLFVHGPLIRDDSQILQLLRRAYVPVFYLFRYTHGSCRGLVLQVPTHHPPLQFRIFLFYFVYRLEQRPRFPPQYAFRGRRKNLSRFLGL